MRSCAGRGAGSGGLHPRHISEQILAVRGAIEGERKQVSVLFCDIVASSALAAELGPEEFHLVIDRFFRDALTEVHRYEGTINQFLGDGFMALFGAPIAHEDHARRTVLAALGVATRAEVKIRIGINSGLVVVGAIGDDLRVDYTAFGDTTVLAARLQAAAAAGAVLVSQQTAGLVRGYFQLEKVAPVEVKERTVCPLRVMGLGSRTARIASGDEMSPFTGRDRELAELQRALEVAAGGEGQVVGVAGDPGLGKSRLALEFRRLAHPYGGAGRPLPVLWGQYRLPAPVRAGARCLRNRSRRSIGPGREEDRAADQGPRARCVAGALPAARVRPARR